MGASLEKLPVGVMLMAVIIGCGVGPVNWRMGHGNRVVNPAHSLGIPRGYPSRWRFYLIVLPAARLGGGFTAGGTRDRKFAGVFETGLGDTGESLPLPAIIVWLPPTRDVWLPPTRGAAQFSVRDAKKLRIPGKSGHLSVEPGAFCHFLSALCPVLSQECPGFIWFCHLWKAGKQARRVWVRKFSLCHFVPFLPGMRLRRETSGQPTPERYKYGRDYDRDMVAGSYRGWKGASVSAVTFQFLIPVLNPGSSDVWVLPLQKRETLLRAGYRRGEYDAGYTQSGRVSPGRNTVHSPPR